MRTLTFPLQNGIDVSTPVSRLRPGTAWVAINFECIPLGGYRRVFGYERFDGRPAPSAATDAATRESRRNAIAAVPGSGPIRGVFTLGNTVYAFRNNGAGTAKNLYASSGSGWSLVTTPALLPGGFLRSIKRNFTGASATEAVYGVDGVNKGFKFDGTTYTEITTGLEPRVPAYVGEFNLHLFFGYGSSLVFSAPGAPLNYVVSNGAGEIAVGDDLTGLQELQGGAFGVFCRDRILILRGTSKADFALTKFSETGAKPDSMQSIYSDVVYCDRQIQRLATTDTFGDFAASALSEPIRPFVQSVLRVLAFSYVVPEKNQYVLFTKSGTGYVATFDDGRFVGWTLFQARHVFTCGGYFELDNGTSGVFVGGENGFVYQLEKGTSFDGLDIQAYLQLAPIHANNFQLRKRFRKITFETDASVFKSLFVSADFDYSVQPRSVQTALDSVQTGLVWNLSNWNEASWNGALKTYAEVYIAGHGRNILVTMFHQSATESPFTLEVMTLNFDDRKTIR